MSLKFAHEWNESGSDQERIEILKKQVDKLNLAIFQLSRTVAENRAYIGSLRGEGDYLENIDSCTEDILADV